MPLSALTDVRQEVTEETLKSRLLPVMVLRVVLITVLLGATLTLIYRAEETFSDPSARFLLVVSIRKASAPVTFPPFKTGLAENV